MDKYTICQPFHHPFLAKWLANYVCMYGIYHTSVAIPNFLTLVTVPCWMEKLQHQMRSWTHLPHHRFHSGVGWFNDCDHVGSFSTVIQDCLGLWILPRCRSNGIVHANMTHFWRCPFKALETVGPQSQGPRASSLASTTGFWAHHWWRNCEHQSMSSSTVFWDLCGLDFVEKISLLFCVHCEPLAIK